MSQHLKPPYTHEELRAKIPQIQAAIAAMTSELDFEVRPMPTMTYDEVKETFHRLIAVANTRALTDEECFMHGQLTNCFETAVRAQMLGLPRGQRWFVMSEAQVLARVQEITKAMTP